MNYDEARAYLSSALRYGKKTSLIRIERLMDLLDHPERELRCLHIAGTNGKGSVSAFCAAILATAGLRTGMYTSPYLERITERIRIIDGRDGLRGLAEDETSGEISHQAFADYLTQIRAASDRMASEGIERPTEFEMLTAMGFLHFRDQRCEIVVLEVGLGGRLDATNIIEKPLACIITALGLDHTDILGNTLFRIAQEKAGIVKSGCPVFAYDPADQDHIDEEVEAIHLAIEDACTLKEAPLQWIRCREIRRGYYALDGQSFSDRRSGLAMSTRMLGPFQPMNAVLAARTIQYLKLADDRSIIEGIAAAFWPGRMEAVRQDPLILLDGAHNLQGCEALADGLSRLLPGRTMVFLCGISADKDHRRMLEIILRRSDVQPVAFYAVQANSPRAMPAELLASEAREVIQAVRASVPVNRQEAANAPAADEQDAVEVVACVSAVEGAVQALTAAQKSGAVLCVFGSLFLIGDVRATLRTSPKPV